jgi:nucleotide-binding universal stress UspA family protein
VHGDLADTFGKILFMERILLAINSQNMDENAINFACFLARLTHSRLTGIFLEKLVLEEEIIIHQSGEGPEMESYTLREVAETVDEQKATVENILRFKEIAASQGIQFFVHLDKGAPATDIIAESRFADILIVDAGTSFSRVEEGPPTRFVKDILQDAGCPVVISPESFNGIDNIVFYYDGSKSSIFAMKQFTYLIPELRNKRAKIIYLNKSKESWKEEQDAVTEWLEYHFSDVEFISLEGDAMEVFFNYLLKKKNDFVVMGTYGKGLLDSFFGNGAEKESTGTTSLPIFIAHY